MRMSKTRLAAAAISCAALLGTGLSTSTASAATPVGHARTVRTMKVAGAAATAYEFVNDNDGLCLDANSAGSSAGHDGDKVQLWQCNGTANQYWIPSAYEINGSYWTVLQNAEYPSECLNADDAGGLANGRHVQLWNCSVDTPNELWDFGAWLNTPGATYLYLDNSPSFVLDATSQHLGNGDQIQIYQPLGGSNQLWY